MSITGAVQLTLNDSSNRSKKMGGRMDVWDRRMVVWVRRRTRFVVVTTSMMVTAQSSSFSVDDAPDLPAPTTGEERRGRRWTDRLPS